MGFIECGINHFLWQKNCVSGGEQAHQSAHSICSTLCMFLGLTKRSRRGKDEDKKRKTKSTKNHQRPPEWNRAPTQPRKNNTQPKNVRLKNHIENAMTEAINEIIMLSNSQRWASQVLLNIVWTDILYGARAVLSFRYVEGCTRPRRMWQIRRGDERDQKKWRPYDDDDDDGWARKQIIFI